MAIFCREGGREGREEEGGRERNGGEWRELKDYMQNRPSIDNTFVFTYESGVKRRRMRGGR